LSINIFKLCDALHKSNPIYIKIQRLSSAFLEKNEVYKVFILIELAIISHKSHIMKLY